MTTQLNAQIARHHIDGLHAEAENRRLARSARRPHRGLLHRLARRTEATPQVVETAEWLRAAAVPGRLPA